MICSYIYCHEYTRVEVGSELNPRDGTSLDGRGTSISIQNLTREADKDLQEYHKLIEMYRQELKSMKTKIENIDEEIV